MGGRAVELSPDDYVYAAVQVCLRNDPFGNYIGEISVHTPAFLLPCMQGNILSVAVSPFSCSMHQAADPCHGLEQVYLDVIVLFMSLLNILALAQEVSH